VGLGANARGVTYVNDFENSAYLPTSTLKLKPCMVQLKIFFAQKFQEHEQGLIMVF
jgi:hypothetical protein